MDKRDYYLEFHRQLDACLHAYLDRQEKSVPGSFQIDNCSVKIPLMTYLFYQLMNQREFYNECRKNGMGIAGALAGVNAYLERFVWNHIIDVNFDSMPIQDHPWYDVLSPYRGQLLIYIFNQRQLNYLTPLIDYLNRPAILVCEYEMDEESALPECVLAISVEVSREQCVNNEIIRKNFPLFFQYANTFDILMRCLSPQCVICLEGCHYQEQLLSVIAEGYHIPSIGIQQGWPSMMRTGFRHLPFKYYFTWGKNFNLCWQRDNPLPEFIEMGYMYEIECKSEMPPCDCIAFFLQGPLFLSDETYMNELINLIKEQAKSFPKLIFLVREHPEYKLPDPVLDDFAQLINVEIVSAVPLNEVLNRSRVVVSHFSSTIMECLVYGAVPLVYDPTTDSRYYPDIEKEALGMIAKTPDEFRIKLSYILDNIALFQRHNHKELSSWFSNTGISTLDAMKQYISAL